MATKPEKQQGRDASCNFFGWLPFGKQLLMLQLLLDTSIWHLLYFRSPFGFFALLYHNLVDFEAYLLNFCFCYGQISC